MYVVPQFSTSKKYSNSNNKIVKKVPDYAKDYKKEFLFIRGIDKCFQYYAKKVYHKRISTLDSRVKRINKYLDVFDRAINKK